jgi:hypothetical protein
MAEPKILPAWKLREYEYYETIFRGEHSSFLGDIEKKDPKISSSICYVVFCPLEL